MSRIISIILPFHSNGVTWTCEGDVYLDGSTAIPRIDCADGVQGGAVRWLMASRLEQVLGRVEYERLQMAFVERARR